MYAIRSYYERRAVDIARTRIEQVAQDQPDRAADHGRRSVARAERIERRAHAELLANRPVHDDEDRAAPGARGRAVQQERLLQHRCECRDHHGKMHRQAARHHRVHRQLFRRDRALAHSYNFV